MPLSTGTRHDRQMSSLSICPCCGFRTLLDEPGSYEVCAVCRWEDDGAPAWACGGPNVVSLVEAQHEFLSLGPIGRLRHRGRRPRTGEAREAGWQPFARTDELLGLVASARAEHERAIARIEEREDLDETRFVDAFHAFSAGMDALRIQARSIPYPEVERRFRALCLAHGLDMPEAELELMARMLWDGHWQFRHPLQAIGWVWRHRRSRPVTFRVRQVVTGVVRFSG
ncbi:CPCC family cysteine-rich protein [Nocardioides sp. WS12]|uniref:CPCC family cysteine-rich protein n=1 Tax=Nocardioides sp. WS12 TaxID=2486272 RepID=UPI00191D4895|nr:CPCC family cysteine-rich protein [Nocardioides sp. WS12]